MLNFGLKKKIKQSVIDLRGHLDSVIASLEDCGFDFLEKREYVTREDNKLRWGFGPFDISCELDRTSEGKQHYRIQATGVDILSGVIVSANTDNKTPSSWSCMVLPSPSPMYKTHKAAHMFHDLMIEIYGVKDYSP